MINKAVSTVRPKALWALRLLLIFSFLLGVPQLVFLHQASGSCKLGSDDFNRADGGLGTSWTPIADGDGDRLPAGDRDRDRDHR